MPDPLQRVIPGDDLVITAETWNLLLEAARRMMAPAAFGRGRAADDFFTPASLARVKNTTGSNLQTGAIVTTAGPAVDPDALPLAARRQPAVNAVAPTTTADPVLILFDDIPDGAFGRAVVAGKTVASVIVSDAAHRYARPIPGNSDSLASADSGPVYLMTPPGVGTALTYVLLGAPPAGSGGDGTTCTGCGWLAALSADSCLALLVDGVAQTVTDGDDTTLVTLTTDESALTWTGGDDIVIGGVNYTVSFTRTPGGLPGLTLTGDGSGSSYTGYFDCCVCGRATFAFSRADLDPDSVTNCGPCDNIIRVSVVVAPCDFVERWYCVRECGTGDVPLATHLLAAEAIDPDIEIVSGPYDSEAEATAACGFFGCCGETTLPAELFVRLTASGCACLNGLVVPVRVSHDFCNMNGQVSLTCNGHAGEFEVIVESVSGFDDAFSVRYKWNGNTLAEPAGSFVSCDPFCLTVPDTVLTGLTGCDPVTVSATVSADPTGVCP